MPATKPVHDQKYDRVRTPAPDGYEAGGNVAAMQQELAARLALPSRSALAPTRPGMAERYIQGISRASGPVLLFVGYGAIAGLLASYIF